MEILYYKKLIKVVRISEKSNKYYLNINTKGPNFVGTEKFFLGFSETSIVKNTNFVKDGRAYLIRDKI